MADVIDTLSFIPGQNLDDSKFTSSQIADAEDLIANYISSRYPQMDVSRNSTIFDLVVRPQALLYLINRQQSQSLMATMSLKGVLDNPELASDATVDAILSNYNIIRREGQKSTGSLRIDVFRNSTYSILKGALFTASNGVQFAAVRTTVASISPTNPDTDIQLQVLPNTSSQYYFIIEVEATTAGLNGKLKDGSQLTPVAGIPNLISVAAFGNFVGGIDKESNEDLISRIFDGLVAKNRASRASIQGSIRSEFSSVLNVATQGMGDPAQSRDASNILGISTGGFADIYIRTSESLERGTISKVATYVETNPDGTAHYTLTIGREDFPGHYRVTRIYPQGQAVSSGYVITSQTKSYDARVNPVDGTATGSNIGNRIANLLQAGYSRYQISSVVFRVAVAPTFPSTLPVTVEVQYQPKVKDVQLFINDFNNKLIMADHLVRAIVPCIVQVPELSIETRSSVSAPAVVDAVFSYVASVVPGRPLQVDTIVDTIRAVPGVDHIRLPLNLSGQILPPDGSAPVSISGSDTLSIPYLPARGIVPENTAFFVEIDNIPVTIIPIP